MKRSEFDVVFPPPAYHTDPAKERLWRYRWLPAVSLRATIRLMLRTVVWVRNEALHDRISAATIIEGGRRALEVVEDLGSKVHITGIDRIAAADGPVVYVGNHMSALETFLLPALLLPHRAATFVVKRSLVEGRMFGPIMRSLDPIAVGREDARADFKQVMTEGLERLSRGVSLCIFPQTTRCLTFEPSTFNTLGEKVARKAGVPVVPIALRTDVWQHGRVIREPGRLIPERDVYMAFGPPLAADGNPRDLHQAVIDFIRDHLASWDVACTV